MRREYGKSGTGGLMLFRGSKSPECNGSATELSEPTFELGLSSIVGKSRHVKNLAPLREKSSNIGPGIHGPSQDIGMLLGRLRLTNQPPEDSGKSDSLFHCTSWRGRSKSLEVEWKVVLNRSTRLNGLNFESGANVGKHRRSEWQRLRVVLLPALVLGAEIESA
jgi:hypothetical protein